MSGDQGNPATPGEGSQGIQRGQGGQGLKHGFGLGPGGMCVCPKCGQTRAHQQGSPCNDQRCAGCGTIMERQETVSEQVSISEFNETNTNSKTNK